FSQKKNAREARNIAERAMSDAQQNELKQMREQAEANYAASVTNAVGQIVGGGIAVGGVAADTVGDFTRNGVVKAAGQAAHKGGPDLAKGISGLASAGSKYDADILEASAKGSGYAAEVSKKAAEDAADDENNAKESARKALDFYREYETAAAQARSAAMF